MTPFEIILAELREADPALERAAGNIIAALGACGYNIVKCDFNRLIAHRAERGTVYYSLDETPPDQRINDINLEPAFLRKS